MLDTFDKFFAPAAGILIGTVWGLMIGLHLVEAPDAPKFHEKVGRTSRAVVSEDKGKNRFITFEFEDKKYTVPFLLPEDDVE